MADSLDFLGDAANYGISLLVLGLSLTLRAQASRIKGVSMGVFGLRVIGLAILNLTSEVVPSAPTMGMVGLSALIANCVVALLLFTYCDGDSNMHSVWICTRDDVLGNIAVLVAALGVFGTRTGWPDLAVAIVMSILALTSASRIFRQANAELRAGADVRSVASKALAALSQRRYLGRYAYSLHGSKSEKTRKAGCYAEGSAETLPQKTFFSIAVVTASRTMQPRSSVARVNGIFEHGAIGGLAAGRA